MLYEVITKRSKESMHRATQAFVEPCFSGKNLGQCSVNQEFDGQFFSRSSVSGFYWSSSDPVKMRIHDFIEFFIA